MRENKMGAFPLPFCTASSVLSLSLSLRAPPLICGAWLKKAKSCLPFLPHFFLPPSLSLGRSSSWGYRKKGGTGERRKDRMEGKKTRPKEGKSPTLISLFSLLKKEALCEWMLQSFLRIHIYQPKKGSSNPLCCLLTSPRKGKGASPHPPPPLSPFVHWGGCALNQNANKGGGERREAPVHNERMEGKKRGPFSFFFHFAPFLLYATTATHRTTIHRPIQYGLPPDPLPPRCTLDGGAISRAERRVWRRVKRRHQLDGKRGRRFGGRG